MDVAGPLFGGMDFIMREAALFAATGFLILGLSDLAVDLLWLTYRVRRLGRPAPALPDLPPPVRPGRLAIFVPAWDEAAVIGDMLRGAVSAWGEGDWRLYVGTYRNDPETAAAAAAVAASEPRVKVVTGGDPGPTTKADCLNRLWLALLADESTEGRRAKAIILHDAEDVVHPAELLLSDCSGPKIRAKNYRAKSALKRPFNAAAAGLQVPRQTCLTMSKSPPAGP